jgi:hypothetical protein
MLVVMLILLTATAMAAASLQSTQYELRSAGYNRASLQTQYTSEAAANSTIAWVDATSMDRSFLTQISSWNSSAHPPNMLYFGEPIIPDGNRGNANRTQWRQQALLTAALTVTTMPPITRTGSTSDPVGSFGPRSNYVAGVQNPDPADLTPSDYVVDLYDCRQLPNTATAGTQVNQGGSGTLTQAQYYCVMTSRGRSYVPGAPSKKWTMPSGDYIVNRFTMSHDARGTIVTPPIVMGP